MKEIFQILLGLVSGGAVGLLVAWILLKLAKNLWTWLLVVIASAIAALSALPMASLIVDVALAFAPVGERPDGPSVFVSIFMLATKIIIPSALSGGVTAFYFARRKRGS
jgi:ABC-type Co2+ transport system permease subunit